MWREGTIIDRTDKVLSLPFFRLELPLPVELALSIPGLWFGVPLFSLFLGPLAVAALASSCAAPTSTSSTLNDPYVKLFLGSFVTCVVFWLVLATLSKRSEWETAPGGTHDIGDRLGFILAYKPKPKSKYSPVLPFLVAPHVALLLLTLVTPIHDAAAAQQGPVAAAAFLAAAWSLIVTGAEGTKLFFRRQRPTICGTPDDRLPPSSPKKGFAGHASFFTELEKPTRHFPEMQKILVDPTTQLGSFPSGDAAGATCVLFTLYAVCGGAEWVKWSCLALLLVACFGRLYFHAHHLLDVTVGSLFGLTVLHGLATVNGFVNSLMTSDRVAAPESSSSRPPHQWSMSWLSFVLWQILTVFLWSAMLVFRSKIEKKALQQQQQHSQPR